jgi:acyl-CoA dehydrogenase
VLRNFPNRALAAMMRLLIFPRGLTYFAPADRLGRKVADLVLNDTATRNRLCRLVYRGVGPGDPLGALQQALELAAVAEPLERKLRVEGQKTGRLSALELPGQIQQARALGILSEAEAQLLADYDRLVMQIIGVDDFAPHELGLVAARTFPRAIAPTIEGDQTCAS